ncbi:hypothetical protein CQW23_10079 [Capsicum baccatum]|uniref:SMP domain-containing protein n=1 Tax=Capsicum baccatum TaxID=33114 RepID=A0A2G2WYM9_CAPBA|nr:hypothetical protein CQW23_10079 [Capsicum baccatum]
MLYPKQGIVWVLEYERIPKALPVDKALMHQKGKKEILEVTPTQKFSQIKNHHMILTELDGFHVEIPLKGCTIAAVSASILISRKCASVSGVFLNPSSPTNLSNQRGEEDMHTALVLEEFHTRNHKLTTIQGNVVQNANDHLGPKVED